MELCCSRLDEATCLFPVYTSNLLVSMYNSVGRRIHKAPRHVHGFCCQRIMARTCFDSGIALFQYCRETLKLLTLPGPVLLCFIIGQVSFVYATNTKFFIRTGLGNLVCLLSVFIGYGISFLVFDEKRRYPVTLTIYVYLCGNSCVS